MDEKKIKSEIFSQRLIIAVLWNICLQICLAMFLIFIIQIDILHPIHWFTSTLKEIFGLKILLNIILLVLVSIFHAIVYGRYHLIPAPKYFTRFSLFLNMFTLQNIVFGFLYALSGYFTITLYSSLAKSNFYTISKTCASYDGQCIVEESLFLQFGGMWIGIYYFISNHILGTSILIFPHVYQDKHQHIKQAIASIIMDGFQNAIVPAIYYCVFYVFWGNKPRSLVIEVYGLHLEDAPLDNILHMIRSRIWLSIWFYISLFFISVNIMKDIFNIILTQPMKFPIQSDTGLTLYAALGQKGHFNQVLAAQDLRTLSMTDLSRRLEIFSLSQPGGHPRNWNNILQMCLSIINEFSKDLDSITCDVKTESMAANNNVVKNESALSNIRNLAQSPILHDLKEHTTTTTEPIMNVIKEEFGHILNKLSQKPGISYLFGELMETKLKVMLIQAQPVMWTCEGLSFLASASLKEDQFGTVQYDLPVVISTLINLKQNLDKIVKPGLIARKQLLNDPMAIKMKSALNSSIKRSIYKITITFSKYINDIPLNPEVQIALQPFLLFKEA